MIFKQATLLAMEASGGNANILDALGIDWKLLVLQAIAFLILVALLGKFVYPVLIRAIDKRQEQLDAGAKASQEAQKQAEKANLKAEEQIKEARKAADDIVATAHKEAGDMVSAAEKRAEAKAEHIVTEAKASLDTEVAAARTALRKETIELVALATEKVIGDKLDVKKDSSLIDRALKEAKI